jgi:hypothetical protein
MHASPTHLRAAELRCQDFLAQAAYDRLAGQACAGRPSIAQVVAGGLAAVAAGWTTLPARLAGALRGGCALARPATVNPHVDGCGG